MKLVKLLFCMTFSISPVVAISSFNQEQTKTINYSSSDVEKNNFSEWYSQIKATTTDNNVQLFFSRYASLAYEECMLPLTYIFTNNKDFKDAWLFYNKQIYDRKTWNIDSFATKYPSLHLITNASQINNDNKISAAYNDDQSIIFIQQLMEFYKNQPNIKFDIWTSEPSLNNFWESWNSTFYQFFKKINKINIIADGNYQIYTFASQVLSRYNAKNYNSLGKTQTDINTKRNEFLNDSSNSEETEFKKYNGMDWVRDNDLFKVFNVYPYTNSSYYISRNKNNVSLYNTYYANYNYYQTAVDLFGDDKTKIDNYCSDYETVFNANNKNSLTDFFWKNADKYNPKKKNLIVLGDSLTENKSYESDIKKAELNKMFKAFFNYYPESEYNIIFKNHPRLYTNDIQAEYIKFAIPNVQNVLYVINTPWEVILSWDYKQQVNDKKYVPLFTNAKKPNDIKSVIVSPQFSTTSIQATTAFLQNTYGYNLDDLNVVASPINFPLPYTYDYISRKKHSNLSKKQQIKNNEDHADKIYQPLVDLGLYPEFKSKQLDTDALYDQSVAYRKNSIESIKLKRQQQIIIISSTSTIAALIFISTVSAPIVLKVKSKKKKSNQN